VRDETAAAEVKAESGPQDDQSLCGQATVAEDAEVEEALRQGQQLTDILLPF